MKTYMCTNCCLPLIVTPQGVRHANTGKPQCTFRDREHQVNAARKVADVRKLEAQLGNS